ncbi:hypothetical protein ABTZ03_30030 [Kitasatospora sp. NPDC096077]|uniref:hypothetical protein n=1 Tax=Kitasatospora sp. NPDC096077 TaxID=3155544 RepID=UPI003331BE46
MEAVVGAVLVGADVVALVVLPRAFRAVFSPPVRLAGVGVLVVVAGLWLWPALVRGPDWFIVAFCVDLGVSAVHTVLALLVGRLRAPVVEPLRLSHFVQEAARFDGPQSIGLMVGHTGAVFVFTARPRIWLPEVADWMRILWGRSVSHDEVRIVGAAQRQC